MHLRSLRERRKTTDTTETQPGAALGLRRTPKLGVAQPAGDQYGLSDRATEKLAEAPETRSPRGRKGSRSASFGARLMDNIRRPTRTKVGVLLAAVALTPLVGCGPSKAPTEPNHRPAPIAKTADPTCINTSLTPHMVRADGSKIAIRSIGEKNVQLAITAEQVEALTAEQKVAHGLLCELLGSSERSSDARFEAVQTLLNAGVKEKSQKKQSVSPATIERLATHLQSAGIPLTTEGIEQFKAQRGLPSDTSGAALAFRYARALQGNEVIVDAPATVSAAEANAISALRELKPSEVKQLREELNAAKPTGSAGLQAKRLDAKVIDASLLNKVIKEADQRGVSFTDEGVAQFKKSHKLGSGAEIDRATAIAMLAGQPVYDVGGKLGPKQQNALRILQVIGSQGTGDLASFKAQLKDGAAPEKLNKHRFAGNVVIDKDTLHKLIERAEKHGVPLTDAGIKTFRKEMHLGKGSKIDTATAQALRAELKKQVHTDTGFINGQSFKIKVVQLDGYPVELHTARAYLAMRAAAAKDGVTLSLNSGFRTHSEQVQLRAADLAGTGNPAAPPGFSNHQSGTALDLNTTGPSDAVGSGPVYDWLAKNAARFGFERIPIEHWHWEYHGPSAIG